MFGIVVAAFLPFLLIFAVVFMKDENALRLLGMMLIAYCARLAWLLLCSELPIFSYGTGGDAGIYETYAEVINVIWRHRGIHYVTEAEFGLLSKNSLAPNLFALTIYFGGVEGGRTGSTGIVALCACLTCLNFYRLSIEFGVPRVIAFRVFCVLLFMPAFFLYTADIYKDGLVLFFVMTAFSSALRLSRKLTVFQMVIGIASCVGLYGCRYYLIFVVVTPLFVSFIGIGKQSMWRKVIGTAVLIALFAVLFGFTNVLQGAQREAEEGYDKGEHSAFLISNAQIGSSVSFDDGGKATGAIHLKLLYTLFSPFPWMTGSVALHLGKIEALIWYYFMYRAAIAGRRLFKEDRSLLAMFATFLVPTAFMYALVMSNVGLIVRERMGVVMVGMLLGTLSWAKSKTLPITDP